MNTLIQSLIQLLLQSLPLFALLTIITGVIYPFALTGLSHLMFPRQAMGSLLFDKNNVIRGSSLIGQEFSQQKYFWSRPSATGPYPYNAAGSSGSNIGPTNPKLLEQVKEKVKFLQAEHAPTLSEHRDERSGVRNPFASLPPQDLLTSSASGLDPHISVAAAEYQLGRVARARNLEPAKLRSMVLKYTEGRDLGILGELRVNVLKLNMALDDL